VIKNDVSRKIANQRKNKLQAINEKKEHEAYKPPHNTPFKQRKQVLINYHIISRTHKNNKLSNEYKWYR